MKFGIPNFFGNRFFSHKPQNQERAQQAPSEVSPLKQRTSSHPAWEHDRTSTGTGFESTRPAVIRQICRVIGIVLAANTDSPESAQRMLAASRAHPSTPPDSIDLRNKTIEAIIAAENLDDATLRSEKLWREIAHAREISHKEVLSILVGLADMSCSEMIASLLEPPNTGTQRKSCDGTMLSEFGPGGMVRDFSIVLAAGRFSSALHRNLSEAHARIAERRAAIDGKGVREKANENLVCVHLCRLSPMGITTDLFSIHPSDISDSYLEAMMQYAAVDYATHIRGSAEGSDTNSEIGIRDKTTAAVTDQ